MVVSPTWLTVIESAGELPNDEQVDSLQPLGS
jgi:hypothetical protein